MNEFLKTLSKEELIELLNIYDEYIQSANEDNFYSTGWKPVCIDEFYFNDFEYWREERDENTER